MRQRINPYLFYFGAYLLLGLGIIAAQNLVLPQVSPLAQFAIASSIAGFILTLFDKSIVGSATMRVPEAVLVFIAFAWGAPGVLLCTNIFRHKTRKGFFQVAVWVALGLQIATLSLLGIDLRLALGGRH